ncbi:hypothetical protein Taro_045867 [Colocasia esculenta]|uniref:Uncharacterized protein n=1 Tax=Colocasia esculenta TaxID=4460 RepID=A0A843WY16_COLES|nr:hypothetical protein [Colocasia esculenta]
MEEETSPPTDGEPCARGDSPDHGSGPREAGPALDIRAPVDRAEILRALEVVERDATAIAESFASLFSSLRLALSQKSLTIVLCDGEDWSFEKQLHPKVVPVKGRVSSTSVEHMRCFNEIIGRLQESALDAATKGNRYINSCLRLNDEMKGMESLAVPELLMELMPEACHI